MQQAARFTQHRKRARLALFDSLAAEVKPHNINVNSVLPSIIDTAANRKAMPGADFSKWPKPEEIAPRHFVSVLGRGAGDSGRSDSSLRKDLKPLGSTVCWARATSPGGSGFVAARTLSSYLSKEIFPPFPDHFNESFRPVSWRRHLAGDFCRANVHQPAGGTPAPQVTRVPR